MTNYENDLNLKMDEIFGFNLSRSLDGVNYDFGQYKLNQIYRPLVRYFVKEFSEHLGSIDESKANEEITLFVDFFKLYFFQGDFGYFKNKYSSFKYKVPYGADYSGNDTELWWASKDCYYVKTSDVVNSIDVQVPRSDLSTNNVSLKFFKKSQPNDNGDYILSVDSSEILDEDENIIGYNIYVYNWDEAKSKKLELIIDKLEELQIQVGGGLINSIKDFLNKRGRDYFIHKNLKEFLMGELERYMHQISKGDIKGKIDILNTKSQIEENGSFLYITADTNSTLYQNTYIRCVNFINILSDLEDFKLRLRTKKRKTIKQEYCISLGKIKTLETLIPRKDRILKYIFENEQQINEWKKLGMSDNPSVEDDSLVVDTKNFEGEQKENLINLINENVVSLKLYNSDNQQALLYMFEKYNGKINCIYIDPPYNTGNDGFIYKDGFNGASWLAMMESKLIVAKDLLTDNGVIFISIDDNEYAQLKTLCDSIFGKENFIQNFLWNKSSGGSSLSKYTRTDYEYVLCYAKDLNSIDYEFLGAYSEGMGDSSLINKPNKYGQLLFKAGTIHFTNKNDGNCIIKAFKDDEFELHNDLIVENFVNKNDVYISCRWKWSQENLDKELSKGTEIISKTRDLRLRYIKDNKGSIIKPTKSITSSDNVGYTVSGSSELTCILGNSPFSYPKPVSLIKYLVRMVTYDKLNSIVLDFFAGSGTTGQAVLELNKEDNGNRRVIEMELGQYFNDVTLTRTKKIQYSQNWKEGKSLDNNGIQSIVEYTKLNQYEDWFSTNGYLTLLNDDIEKLSELKDIDNVTQIISPLETLKDRIYNIDDELSNDQLLEISNNK